MSDMGNVTGNVTAVAYLNEVLDFLTLMGKEQGNPKAQIAAVKVKGVIEYLKERTS